MGTLLCTCHYILGAKLVKISANSKIHIVFWDYNPKKQLYFGISGYFKW